MRKEDVELKITIAELYTLMKDCYEVGQNSNKGTHNVITSNGRGNGYFFDLEVDGKVELLTPQFQIV
ncbi:MAG: hypothetical protein DRH37_08655 [Deltaproteobacteria bacterium]|nr:MAG: hypothetical protein DRH37_08655 [Deltaproteobacteria bacterium]